MSEVKIMKTNVNKLYTKSNIIILLVGLLTPVVLFSALATSLYNKSAEVKPAIAETATVENVAISNEMFVAPKAYIYKNANGDDEVEITPDTDNICLKGSLITPSLNRF